MSAELSVQRFKRGDSFEVTLERIDPVSGAPIDLTGWSILSQVRAPSGELISNLVVTVASQSLAPGRITLFAPISATEQWPIGHVLLDVQESNGTYRRSSVTIKILVEQDVTR